MIQIDFATVKQVNFEASFFSRIDDLHISHNASGVGANVCVLLVHNSSSHISLDEKWLGAPRLSGNIVFYTAKLLIKSLCCDWTVTM